jgi:hypothetical protein
MAQQRQDDGAWLKVPYDPDLEVRHNYDAFAALANVRNRSGIQPIAQPRGWPADFVASVDKEGESPPWVDPYYGDLHSHSWLSLPEIYAYDWTGIGGYAPNGCSFADVCHRSFDHLGDPSRIRLVFCFVN